MIYDRVIKGKSIDLRAMAPEDAEFTYNLRQDKERTKYLHAVNGTVEDQRKWIERQRASRDCYMFIVADKQGNPLGMIGYYDIRDGVGEIGREIITGTHLQNFEAEFRMRGFVFETLGASEYRATAMDENIAVQNMIKRGSGRLTGWKYDAETGHYIFEYLLPAAPYFSNKERCEQLIKKAWTNGLNI